MTTRRRFLRMSAALAAAGLHAYSNAQAWPSRPIRAIVSGVIEKFKPQGIEPMQITSREFDALIAKEIDSNIAIVKAAGLQFN